MGEAAVAVAPAGAPPEVAVQIACGDWDAADDPDQICRAAVAAAIAEADPPNLGEIGILLADDARLRELNHRFRGIDQPTNVLAFTGSPDGGSLGDIAIAFETAAGEAAAHGKPFAAHLAHLVVHGTLHLLGLDHATEAEAAVMEGQERRALARLGIGDPYVAGGGSE